MPWFLPGSDASSSRQDMTLSPLSPQAATATLPATDLSSRFEATPARGSASAGRGLSPSAKESSARVHFGFTDDPQTASSYAQRHSQPHSDRHHLKVLDRRADAEVLKLSQQYHQLLNKPLPPPPVGGGPGCRDGCCWRWLTAMLLQEMQVLRKALAESREAFVEQERTFAGLDEPPDEWGYNELLNQYMDTKAEHEELSARFPELKETNRELREVISQRKQDLLAAEAKVKRLSELQDVEDVKLRELEERLYFLQNNMKENEEKERKVKESEKNAHSKLRLKLEHIQVVTDDHHGLLLRRDMLQAGERSKKRRAKNASPTGTSSPSRKVGARATVARNPLESLTRAASPPPLPSLAENSTALPSLAEASVAAPGANASAGSTEPAPAAVAQQPGSSSAESGPPEAQRPDEAGGLTLPDADDALSSMPLAGRWGDMSSLRKKAGSPQERKQTPKRGSMVPSKARGSTP